MNYALYATWIRDKVEDLVQFGVPRAEAESLMQIVERGGMAAECNARQDDQFLLDFKRLGSETLAARHGISRQAICKRRSKLLNRQPAIDRRIVG